MIGPDGAAYVLSSRVDDFAGRGAAIIQWQRVQREAPVHSWVNAIVDVGDLDAQARAVAERALAAQFTRHEAASLRHYLAGVFPALAADLHMAILQPPFYPVELLALYEETPDPDSGRCLVRLPESGPPPPVPIAGIAAPWPSLAPGDIARLIDQRTRLGLDPIPPQPFRR